MNALEEINRIFRDVMDNDSLVITRETTAADVEEWDSLNHIHLVVTIEKFFKIRFTSVQIQSWKNVGAMCDDIEKALKR